MARALIPVPRAVADPHVRSPARCAGFFKANFASLLRQPPHLLPGSPRVLFRPLHASVKQAVQGSGARDEESWQVQRILTVGETVIVVLGAASHVYEQFRASVAPTTSQPTLAAKQYSMGSFQVLLLWAALVVNALLRARGRKTVRPSIGPTGMRASTGLILTERVTGLEEELRQGLILTRGVARQVEKLGIRVRTVRQTLRDPIQATTRVAAETFEVMGSIVSRQDVLERQLKELTQALCAMQEQQGKQLQVVATALKKISKSSSAVNKGHLFAKKPALVVDLPSHERKSSKSSLGDDERNPLALVERPTSLAEATRAGEVKKQGGRVSTTNGDWGSRVPSGPSTFVAAQEVANVDFWADPSG